MLRYADGWFRGGAEYRQSARARSGGESMGLVAVLSELWPWLLALVTLAWAFLGFVSQ